MISVILPCYREPPNMFQQALESIIQQTYKNLEVIVIMDGPNTELENVLNTYQKRDARIHYYVNEMNQGLPYSLNRGISLATGEYIARMDADDICLPERFDKELKYLKDNHLDLVGTYCEKISDAGVPVGFMYSPTSPYEIYMALPKGNCLWHPTWLFRKEVWERVGGYDNFRHCQDYHFLLKCRKMEVRLGVLPEVCLKYRLSAGGIGRQKFSSYPVTAEYFAEHAEDILDITPDTLKAFLDSAEGKSRMQEINTYINLRDQFKKSVWNMPWYGAQMFCLAYGRKRLYEKIKSYFKS